MTSLSGWEGYEADGHRVHEFEPSFAYLRFASGEVVADMQRWVLSGIGFPHRF